MDKHISTFRYPTGDWRRIITNGGGRQPIGVSIVMRATPIDGQRTILTVRRPGPCSLICTV